MTILRSAIVFNSVSGEHGGGILNNFEGEENPLVLVNTTVFGNSAAENGGGIYVDLGPVTLTNCTVAGNEAGSEGGGIGPENIPNQVFLANTIVASNEAPVGPDGSIAAVSLGNNLIGSTSGFPVALLPSDLVGDPGFEDFTDDGTAGNAHVPLRADSRALNAGGDEACPSVDQLGTLRPQQGGCDIGAFELPGASFPTTIVLDDFDQRDGPLGRAWQPRRLRFFDVEGGQLHVNAGGLTLWSRAFGAAQEAYVTFAAHDSGSGRQGLLLKVQKIPRRGAIAVTYFAPQKKVVIETFLPRRGWSELARSGVVEIDSGDQLGARVWPDGGLEVFINGSLVLTARAEAFFDGRGGRIGLILEQAGGAVLDDFGGGNAPLMGSSGI
jgi:predicted outer membrane repeat protein